MLKMKRPTMKDRVLSIRKRFNTLMKVICSETLMVYALLENPAELLISNYEKPGYVDIKITIESASTSLACLISHQMSHICPSGLCFINIKCVFPQPNPAANRKNNERCPIKYLASSEAEMFTSFPSLRIPLIMLTILVKYLRYTLLKFHPTSASVFIGDSVCIIDPPRYFQPPLFTFFL